MVGRGASAAAVAATLASRRAIASMAAATPRGPAPDTQNLGEELGQVCVRSMATCCDTARGYATSLRTRASYLF